MGGDCIVTIGCRLGKRFYCKKSQKLKQMSELMLLVITCQLLKWECAYHYSGSHLPRFYKLSCM